MSTLQQLLSQTVQQNMGLADILAQKQRESEMYGQVMQKVEALKSENQIAAYKEQARLTAKKMELDRETKKEGTQKLFKDTVASLQSMAYEADDQDKIDKLTEISKTLAPQAKAELDKDIVAAKTRLATATTKETAKVGKAITEETKAKKELKKAGDETKKDLRSSYVSKIQSAATNEALKAIVKAAGAKAQSGDLDAEDVVAINNASKAKWNDSFKPKKSKPDIKVRVPSFL